MPVFARLLLSALAQVDLLQSSVLCEAFFSLVSLTIGRLSLSFLLQMARRCAAAPLGLALNCSFLPKDTLCFTLDYVLCSNSGGLHQQASLLLPARRLPSHFEEICCKYGNSSAFTLPALAPSRSFSSFVKSKKSCRFKGFEVKPRSLCSFV